MKLSVSMLKFPDDLCCWSMSLASPKESGVVYINVGSLALANSGTFGIGEPVKSLNSQSVLSRRPTPI